MNRSETSAPAAPRARPRLVSTAQEVREMLAPLRRAGRTIGLVPTMGALHAGHLSLVEASRRECDFTVVSVFVNPAQFGPGEDYQRYPRTLEADLEALAGVGTELVFAPQVGEMYGPRHSTYVEVGRVAEPLEGSFRPGHFRGVATIVLKLFHVTMPDRAYFGQKDYQQSLVVRRMVDDLDLPIEIRVCPIVREADGLALSSRNVYLSSAERRQALVLDRSLRAAAEMAAAGQRDAAAIVARMRGLVAAEPAVQVDYLVLVDPETLDEVSQVDRTVLAAVAARVGSTRLIDNRLIEPGRK